MRDGVDLRADHYEPLTDRPAGTILVRGPYGRGFPFSFIYAQIYAARGYHVVLQSVRGTFGSGGTFVPMVHEVDDAADTVVWLREQSWFTGTFGTIGLSYLGYTQWALLSDPPPELAAAVISVGPHDFHGSSWGTGSFALNDFLGWSDMMAHQERPPLHRLAFQVKAPRRLASAVHNVPLGHAGRMLLGEHSPWYESWIEHPDVDDPFWDPMRMTRALDRCTVPVLLISGWQDIFIDQTITQYQYLHRRGMDVALTVGPWTHDEMVTKAAGTTAVETLNWLGAHLSPGSPGSGRERARAEPVRVYVTGESRGWVDLPDWPPATDDRVFYPNRFGVLDTKAPDYATVSDGGTATFRYDPADPTPTIGGRLLTRNSGYTDDTDLARRADVVTFTTPPLDAGITAFGHPVVALDYQTDNPHFDVFVRISEVDEKGCSHNVSDGFRRFDTGPEGPLRVELDPIAHRFGAGTRIRVLLAGGCHPRFARNLGTGEPSISGSRMVGSTHTVRFGADTKLVLPGAPD